MISERGPFRILKRGLGWGYCPISRMNWLKGEEKLKSKEN